MHIARQCHLLCEHSLLVYIVWIKEQQKVKHEYKKTRKSDQVWHWFGLYDKIDCTNRKLVETTVTMMTNSCPLSVRKRPTANIDFLLSFVQPQDHNILKLVASWYLVGNG